MENEHTNEIKGYVECPCCNKRIMMSFRSIGTGTLRDPMESFIEHRLIDIHDILWVNGELANAYEYWRKQTEKLQNERWSTAFGG